MDVHAAGVARETKLPELNQKDTGTGARRADHLGQRFLTDLRNDRLRLAFFPTVRQQQLRRMLKKSASVIGRLG